MSWHLDLNTVPVHPLARLWRKLKEQLGWSAGQGLFSPESCLASNLSKSLLVPELSWPLPRTSSPIPHHPFTPPVPKSLPRDATSPYTDLRSSGLGLFSDLLVYPASMMPPLLAPSLLWEQSLLTSFAVPSSSAHLLGLQVSWDLVLCLPGYTGYLKIVV